MQTPSVLRLVEACARGARVTVIIAGKTHALPREQETVTLQQPNPIEVLSQQLLARDTEMRMVVEGITAIAERADARTAEAQELLAKSVDAIAAAQAPVLDAAASEAEALLHAAQALDSAAATIEKANERLAQSAENIAATLGMDVEPVYDDAGRLVRARRVPA